MMVAWQTLGQKQRLSLLGKHLTISVANDTIWAFKPKWECCTACCIGVLKSDRPHLSSFALHWAADEKAQVFAPWVPAEKFKPHKPWPCTGELPLLLPPNHSKNQSHRPLVLKSFQTTLGACPALSRKPQSMRNECFCALSGHVWHPQRWHPCQFWGIDPALHELPQDNKWCEQDALCNDHHHLGTFLLWLLAC